MKLLSCHVEGFGALKDRDFSFESGLNVAMRENGSGKTTLCAFIRAMLYGLPSVRADSFNDRSHYAPFDGSRYGGNLVIEKRGTVYRIERFFDKKSEKKDECKVYCNDKLTDIACVGQEIFGLNESSFARTVYFDSNDTESETDEELVLKLNRTVENTDGEALNKAMFLLGRAKKSYRADRGNNDEISHAQESLVRVEKQLAEAETTKAELLEKEERYYRLEANIPLLEQAEEECQGRKLASERYSYYKAACDEREKYYEEERALKAVYPLGVPDEEELKEISIIEKEEIFYRGKEEELSFDSLPEWEALNARYGEKEPSDETISAIKQERDELMVLEAKLASYADGNYPVEGVRFSKLPFWILFILSAVAIGLGVAFKRTGFYEEYSLYLILGAFALLLLSGVAFLICSAAVNRHNKNLRRETREELMRRESGIREELQAFFAEYGLDGEIKDLPDQMQGELVSFHALSAEKSDKERRKKEFDTLKQKNDARLAEIARKYGLKDLSFDRLSEAKVKENALITAISSLDERAEKYKTEPVSYSEEEEIEIREKLKESRKEAVELKTAIEQMERVAELADVYRSERESVAAHLADCQKRERLLLKTMELMTAAEESLREKYISPVKDHFRRYGAAVKKATSVDLSLGEDLSVSFEKNGERRLEAHLSSGERAIAVLCFRLSLLDGLYREDAPFLLFDDPFVQLDKEALEKMGALLKDLSADRQILYFTCHESRAF